MRGSKDCIARRLKEARSAVGISQKKLGILAGIDESSASVRISQYETGTHTPNILTLRNIGKVLGYPVEFFISDDDLTAELVRVIEKLPETKKYKILDIAKELAFQHSHAETKLITEEVF